MSSPSQRAVALRGSPISSLDIGKRQVIGGNPSKSMGSCGVQDTAFTSMRQHSQQGHQLHSDPPGFVFLVEN